jgi:hypothetical protein
LNREYSSELAVFFFVIANDARLMNVFTGKADVRSGGRHVLLWNMPLRPRIVLTSSNLTTLLRRVVFISAGIEQIVKILETFRRKSQNNTPPGLQMDFCGPLCGIASRHVIVAKDMNLLHDFGKFNALKPLAAKRRPDRHVRQRLRTHRRLDAFGDAHHLCRLGETNCTRTERAGGDLGNSNRRLVALRRQDGSLHRDHCAVRPLHGGDHHRHVVPAQVGMHAASNCRWHQRDAASFEILLHNGAASRFRRMPNLQSTRVWQVLRWRRIDYTQDSAGTLQFRLITCEAKISKRRENVAELATREAP